MHFFTLQVFLCWVALFLEHVLRGGGAGGGSDQDEVSADQAKASEAAWTVGEEKRRRRGRFSSSKSGRWKPLLSEGYNWHHQHNHTTVKNLQYHNPNCNSDVQLWLWSAWICLKLCLHLPTKCAFPINHDIDFCLVNKFGCIYPLFLWEIKTMFPLMMAR